ncbi:SDR family NAD(P)-dependent oxidoreductase [Lysobacter arvi]|uniref:SDR family NAD(P)-dependent oxidoreductase n=1 Tax=Lysobacter arvi TaxID=3038776 RepID=A0ABU1CC25_9GAMM|nr:SDR family NAD(P)-dependent oxidoreductase [Lysobacter arvi]MDR0182625.1 SDR family NAD(P)-dependent oxidoreductase [Lysobacter arvi]
MNAPTQTLDPRRDGPVLITGGAGFIGTNLATRLLESGRRVVVFDNLSRPGVQANAHWLWHRFGDRVSIEIADVRDAERVRAAVGNASQVFHFAAQVAVTSSLVDPRDDFEINLGGTLNVLEAMRGLDTPPSLVFTSTNKVYGALGDVALEVADERYRPCDGTLDRAGVAESRPLDFHSPYGCSKGGADQYVLDYARSYGLPAAVFRMSCIYGPHQCGNEDQGWVAHFLKRALHREPITLYGDGRQVRDILFVQDLADAFIRCQARMSELAGRAFNMGGGPANALSLREVLGFITALIGRAPRIEYGPWRVGDQRWYVSDTQAFQGATGWTPTVDAREGIARLHDWLVDSMVPGAHAVAPASRTHAA